MSYKIKLPEFEGPFDLLLFFIERDELDIYDIPIAQITKDYLAYIKELENLNIDVASEFILMASTLMRIKVRMLLPRKNVDEEGNEIDARKELVERLLEYKRYKNMLSELRELEKDRLLQHQRGNVLTEMHTLNETALNSAELENLSLFRLLKSYEAVMNRYKEQSQKLSHQIIRYNYTIEERRNYIHQQVSIQKRIHIGEIFTQCKNKIHAIFTFLAILELLQQEKVFLELKEGFNNFFLLDQTANHSEE